jgi:hypothetical protein
MARLKAITVISIVIGYGAYRSNWLEHTPSLLGFIGTYVLASLLTFINVWLQRLDVRQPA